MDIRLKIMLLLLGISIWGLLVIKLRRKVIDIKYALPWLVLDMALIVLIAIPSLMEKLAAIMGIQLPSNMFFFFGLLILLFICYEQTITISKHNTMIRRLVQEIAIEKNKTTENLITKL